MLDVGLEPSSFSPSSPFSLKVVDLPIFRYDARRRSVFPALLDDLQMHRGHRFR